MTSSLKFLVFITGTSLLAQTGKNLSAVPKTWVGSLSQKDLQKGMATHSSNPAWEIPWRETPVSYDHRIIITYP